MRSLNYYRPAVLSEVLSALRDDPQAKVLAGGQTLLPALKLRLAAPSRLIDLQGIDELRGIVVKGNRITVAAMTTHAQVASNDDVRRLSPALAAVAGCIGDRMVRNMGTIGGSIANNDPAADYPAALLGLNATIVTTSRRIPATAFFQDLYQTALADQELVTAVEFPISRRAAYVKFKHPASRFALVGVFVAETEEGPRAAVTGAGSVVFRVPEYENALAGEFRAESLIGVSAKFGSLNSDLHASADYRAHLIPEIARRALLEAQKADGPSRTDLAGTNH
jgi:carbon-monoxide dehydrogenase medium subunit